MRFVCFGVGLGRWGIEVALSFECIGNLHQCRGILSPCHEHKYRLNKFPLSRKFWLNGLDQSQTENVKVHFAVPYSSLPNI